MSRHTTFRFCLDPTDAQTVLARHAGASRFAFNQCLRIVKLPSPTGRLTPDTRGPWSGFDLINVFNAWKKSEHAGRVFTVDGDGVAETVVTGWHGGPGMPAGIRGSSHGLRAGSRHGRIPSGTAQKKAGRFPRLEEPSAGRHFVCATSTARRSHRQSESVTIIVPARSTSPVSVRSRCTTTPAGCGDARERPGKDPVRHHQSTGAAAGGYR